MRRLEIDKHLDKLLRRVGTKREDASPDAARDTVAEDALYSALRELPGPTLGDDGRMLVLCRERVEGQGEDSFLAAKAGERVLLSVFDGCGGSGARVYPAFGDHTGAWVASRAVTAATRAWFAEDGDGDALAGRLDEALQGCKALAPSGQALMGSLSREFPTTMAAFCKAMNDDWVELFWCGDSRCYALDAKGLHQLTADDAFIQDALRNLREDAPMTNVLCASRPFELHRRRVKLERPTLLLAATDGCFGYLPSPMDFERLLLKTLARAKNAAGWRRGLDKAIGAVSGDDYTLAAWPYGFAGYQGMKRTLSKRLSELNERFPAAADEDALNAQWEAYRPGYEAMLPKEEKESERGEA